MTYTWHYSTSSVLYILSVLYIQFFWFQSHFLLYLIFKYFIVGYLYIYLFNMNMILESVSQKKVNAYNIKFTFKVYLITLYFL